MKRKKSIVDLNCKRSKIENNGNCKSCGNSDHKRSSSHLCPNNNPRFSSCLPDNSFLKEGQFWKTNFFTVKMGLRTILKDRSLELKLQNIVNNVTKLCFHSSRLLNLHLLKMFSTGAKLSEKINETFIRKFFFIFIKNEKSDLLIKETFDIYVTNISHHWLLQSNDFINCSQILTYTIKSYLVNVENHLKSVYWKNLKMAFKFSLLYLENDNSFLEFETFFEKKPTKNEIITKYGREFVMFEDSVEHPLLQAVYESSIYLGKQKRAIFIITKFTLRNLIVKYDKKILQKNNDFDRYVKRVTSLSEKLNSLLRKMNIEDQHTIVPLYTMASKYITIDTDVLYYLMRDNFYENDKIVNIATFGKKYQIEAWKKFLKIRDSFFPKELEETPKPNKKLFSYQISTDGVGCSVLFKKFIVVNKKQEQTSIDKLDDVTKKQDQMSIDNLDNTVWIGVDPGRKDVLSYIKMLPDQNGNVKEKKYSLSNGEYYQRCHFKQRNSYINQKLKQIDEGLLEWRSNIPVSKTLDPTKFIKYLSYIFSGDNQIKIFEMNQQRQYKIRKWGCYINKQKTIHEVCKDIVEKDIEKDQPVIVAFGDASFNASSKGYSASPRRKQFYQYLKRAFEDHRRRIISTSEFNTSLVCSKCLNNTRLKAATEDHIVKKHFVRRCQNPTCRTLWNRDVNASRNMITVARSVLLTGKKPEIFATVLPKDNGLSRR
jgi:hypothetical protein